MTKDKHNTRNKRLKKNEELRMTREFCRSEIHYLTIENGKGTGGGGMGDGRFVGQEETGTSRGHGKSPAPNDPSMSSEETKKMKVEDGCVEIGLGQKENSEIMDAEEEDECYLEDEMDDSDYEMDLVASNSEGNLDYIISDTDLSSLESFNEDICSFEVLSPPEIVRSMEEYINSANNVLQLPLTTMRGLLTHFRWDKDKLCEAYFSGGDAERRKLFLDANMVEPSSQASGNSIMSSRKVDGKVECEICCSQILPAEMYGMKCGHFYCTHCWTQFLTEKITEAGMGQAISCIAHNCNFLVDDEAVMKLITDPKVRLKYQHHITNSFVLCNSLMKWCPSPDCNYAVKVQHIDKNCHSVTCKCGHSFCFNCVNKIHAPISCDMLKKWLKKCADDSETSNWISVNTKDCPKCKAPIQKNGGCNHMTCRNSACGENFCWICLGPWGNHDAYRCNRYNENDAEANEKQEKSRESLNRYLFHFHRYVNHLDSLKLERNLYESVEEKMSTMQTIHAMSHVEVQFLKLAVDALCQCRQTLMYTYVFAFYVEKTTQNNQIQIFETNQEDLQAATEKLSACLERDENLNELRQKVQDMSKYCESRRKVLLDHVREGYEKDWWKLKD